MNGDEQRGYSKGYQAGRRRSVRDDRCEEVARLREDFIQRMMLAIAAQQISDPWGRTVNGVHKPYTTAKEMMGNARNIAEEAAKLCVFMPARQSQAVGA